MSDRLVFMGTPAAAVPSLRTLAERHTVELVVTRPRRPRVAASPVELEAIRLELPLTQPTDVRDLARVMAGIAPIDLAVVVAFGMILPEEVLGMPGHGCLNLHFSLLPRWRGAAPVERAILAGDASTGVTVFRMTAGLDTGPILAQKSTVIGADETAPTLSERLSHIGAHLLVEVVDSFLAGRLAPRDQPEDGITMAPKITPDELRLDITESRDGFIRRVRAFSPRAWLSLKGNRVLVATAADAGHPGLATGELAIVDRRVLLGLADGAVELKTVQAAGKQRMTAVDWANGLRGELGHAK